MDLEGLYRRSTSHSTQQSQPYTAKAMHAESESLDPLQFHS
jgi:hypothetical protein